MFILLLFFRWKGIRVRVNKIYIWNRILSRIYKTYKTNSFEPKNDNNEPSSKLKKILTKLSLKPIIIYENLELKKTQLDVKEFLKNKGGIYMIINLVNEKFYVGSAINDKLYSRFMNHLIYCCGSDILAKAVEKYGLSNFSFIILELCDLIINKKDNK